MKKIKNMYESIFDKLYMYRRFRIHNSKSRKIKIKNKLYKNELLEAKRFWKQYTNKQVLKFINHYTSVSGYFNKNYIPDNLYYSYIDYKLNNHRMAYGIDNKSYYSLFLPTLKHPDTVVRKINGSYYDSNFDLIDSRTADELVKDNGEFLLKQSIDSCGGKNIYFLDNNSKNTDSIIREKDNYVIQRIVKQHEVLDKLHPNSLNTIRVISLFWNDEIKILSSVLRIGINNNRVDNASSGGIVVGINEDGYLKKYAYTANGDKFNEHPNTKIIFEGIKVPCFEEITKSVLKEAIKFPNFRLISWDFGVDKHEDPVFIEFNLHSGQLDFHQFCNGPLFGDLTEDILKTVFP